MGKCTEPDPEKLFFKKFKKVFNESREKLGLSHDQFSFEDFSELFDGDDKLIKKLFDLIVKETYNKYKNTGNETQQTQRPTILFTSSPVTAMLHLVTQANSGNTLTFTIPQSNIQRRQPQRRTSQERDVVTQIVNSMSDEPIRFREDDDIENF